MSPNPLTSTDTSEKRVAPDPNDANVQSDTLILHPSSTINNGAQGPDSSNSSAPPPYVRNTPLDNPFRDSDAPVGYSYPNGSGIPRGLKSATATHDDAFPADSLPPVTSANDDPFAVDLVLNENLVSRPPLPARSSGLSRGLHIPSRASHITWGFSFPEILAEQGVTKPQWKLFMHEVKAFASMSIGQWATAIACTTGIGIVFGYIAIPGALFCHYKMQKHREHRNFLVAYQSGAMKTLENRWNDNYFHQLGLHIRIEPPGIGNMDGMDVASSKLFRYQHKMGTSSPALGVSSKQGHRKEYWYQSMEGHYRMNAARKARVVVLPFNMVNPLPSN